MIKFFSIVLIIFMFQISYSQFDKHSNPVLNSITIEKIEIEDFTLEISYYSISDNINNKKSSAYVSDEPSLTQIQEFAISIPSYFFLLSKKNDVKYIIKQSQKIEKGKPPQYIFNVIESKSSNSQEFSFDLIGDFTEHRVKEILEKSWDPKSSTLNYGDKELLKFNGILFSYLDYETIKSIVMVLIEKLELTKKQ